MILPIPRADEILIPRTDEILIPRADEIILVPMVYEILLVLRPYKKLIGTESR